MTVPPFRAVRLVTHAYNDSAAVALAGACLSRSSATLRKITHAPPVWPSEARLPSRPSPSPQRLRPPGWFKFSCRTESSVRYGPRSVTFRRMVDVSYPSNNP